MRLKFCPQCRYHKPTRGAHVVCSSCRASAKRRGEGIAAERRPFFRKLIRFGMSPNQALHEVSKA